MNKKTSLKFGVKYAASVCKSFLDVRHVFICIYMYLTVLDENYNQCETQSNKQNGMG